MVAPRLVLRRMGVRGVVCFVCGGVGFGGYFKIVGREALRDEVYNFYFILKVTLCMLSDKEESLFQGVLVFIVKTKSVWISVLNAFSFY